ncbi:MAG: ATP-binding cassette domain-containing protein [Bacteroidota bacterium]
MLEISKVRFSYQNHQISFPDWEVTADENGLILGDSGSGKTTLLHLIGGLRKPKSGVLKVQNTEISKLSSKKLDEFRGKYIGIVFQKPHLVSSLSVLENILLAQFLGRGATDKAAATAVLDQLGIERLAGRKISEISQGQAQRVAIARAVINSPALLLADEPTASLDDKSCEQAISLLFEQAARNKASLVVATHDHRIKSKFKNELVL